MGINNFFLKIFFINLCWNLLKITLWEYIPYGEYTLTQNVDINPIGNVLPNWGMGIIILDQYTDLDIPDWVKDPRSTVFI